MWNWIVRNRTVWSFDNVYLQNKFTNHISDIYVKTGFSIKLPTMADMPENQTTCVKMDLGVMVMKEYSALPKALEMEPHH